VNKGLKGRVVRTSEGGLEGQVGPRVALHVHQAASDPSGRPYLAACALRAAKPVRDQYVGRGDA